MVSLLTNTYLLYPLSPSGERPIAKSAQLINFPGRWFLNDPSTYADPSSFQPERFLGPNPEPAPDKMGAFGYGRRVCTGRALAEQTGWLLIAETLSVFRIAPGWDEETEKRGERYGTGGIIHHPAHFEPRIILRDGGGEGGGVATRQALLDKVDGELSWDEGDARLVDVTVPVGG